MTPLHLKKNGQPQTDMPSTITNSKDLEYDLTSQKKDFIELDQWPPRCSSIRTDPSYKVSPPCTISTPFPDEVEHKRSSLHKTEKPVIANHSEIRLISLGNTIIVTRRHNDWCFSLQRPGTSLTKRNRTKVRCSPNTNVHHPSFELQKDNSKNSVKPGWVEPDLNYILWLDKLDILPL